MSKKRLRETLNPYYEEVSSDSSSDKPPKKVLKPNNDAVVNLSKKREYGRTIPTVNRYVKKK
jgi:hypothetical protein